MLILTINIGKSHHLLTAWWFLTWIWYSKWNKTTNKMVPIFDEHFWIMSRMKRKSYMVIEPIEIQFKFTIALYFLFSIPQGRTNFNSFDPIERFLLLTEKETEMKIECWLFLTENRIFFIAIARVKRNQIASYSICLFWSLVLMRCGMCIYNILYVCISSMTSNVLNCDNKRDRFFIQITKKKDCS